MKLSFFNTLKLRTKIILIVILTLILATVSVLTVLYESGRIGTKADANTHFVDLDSVVQTRADAITACNSDSANCPSYLVNPDDIRGNLVGLPVVYANTIEARSEASTCSDAVTKNQIPGSLFGRILTNQGNKGATCTLEIKKVSDNEISINIGVKKSQNIASDFPVRYQSITGSEEFQGDEKLSSGNVSYDIRGLIVKGTYKNNQWYLGVPDIKTISSSGNITAAYEVNIDGTLNMLNYTKNQYPDFTIDPTSSWTVTTSGRLNGAINMDYSKAAAGGAKYVVHTASFCPSGCEVTMNESLRLKAQKKGTTDKIKGTIKSDADNEEIYKGTGAFDASSNRFVWQDLTVKKTDIRSWTHDLTYNNQTSVHYAGRTSADALLQPTKNISSVKNDIYKTIKVSSSFMSMKKSNLLVYQSTVDQSQTSKNNKLISRTGTGSYSFNGNTTYSGIYDTISTQLLIKNSPTKSYLNTRRDPFVESPVSQYTNTYFQKGSIFVPGFFTATSTDATKTILSTPAKKYLPANFVYLKSYTSDNKEWSKSDQETMDKLISDFRARGVNVVIYNTQSKQAMLDAFSKIPSGSWVLHSGHGLDNGLEAGKEFVTYDEIMKVLNDKQVKIDVFAADSCFAGRAPIGQTVIGSMGIGFGNIGGGVLQPAGSLFMFGGNLWSGTTNDIVAALNSVAKQNSQTSSKTTTPIIRWPFKL